MLLSIDVNTSQNAQIGIAAVSNVLGKGTLPATLMREGFTTFARITIPTQAQIAAVASAGQQSGYTQGGHASQLLMAIAREQERIVDAFQNIGFPHMQLLRIWMFGLGIEQQIADELVHFAFVEQPAQPLRQGRHFVHRGMNVLVILSADKQNRVTLEISLPNWPTFATSDQAINLGKTASLFIHNIY